MFEGLLNQIAMSAIRHGVTAGGAILVSDGLATSAQTTDLLGSVLFLAGFAWSVADKIMAKNKLVAAKAA